MDKSISIFLYYLLSPNKSLYDLTCHLRCMICMVENPNFVGIPYCLLGQTKYIHNQIYLGSYPFVPTNL